MWSTDPSEHWKRWGAQDPYFGVLSSDEYHRGRMDEAARRRFFEGGEAHVAQVLQTVRRHFDPAFAPARALDFGCGVGRVTLALARQCREVVGVDVAPAMLAEAARNAAVAGVGNAAWVEADEGLTRVSGGFGLVHSVLVFQHVRPAAGYRIVRRLLAALEPGGAAALHFIARSTQPAPVLAARWVQSRVPGANLLVNLLKRRPLATPNMEANVYDLATLLELCLDAGCGGPLLQPFRHQGGLHATLFAHKRAGGGRAGQGAP